jgi:surface antigen
MPIQRWIMAKLRRLVPIVAVLAVLGGGVIALNLVAAAPALADTGGYPWSSATALDEATDDYGYATCPSNDSGCMAQEYVLNGVTYGEYDPWNYYLRNCTSYVAWKISQEFNGRNISGWGDAKSWATSAQNVGYHLDSTPQVGDIAVWGPEVGDGHGHVAYVASVSNGVATFDEYNVAETGAYTDSYTSADHPGGQVYPDWYIHMGTPADGGGGSGGGSTSSSTSGSRAFVNPSNNEVYGFAISSNGDLWDRSNLNGWASWQDLGNGGESLTG